MYTFNIICICVFISQFLATSSGQVLNCRFERKVLVGIMNMIVSKHVL